MTSTVLLVIDWGSVPDYLIVLSIVGGALSLVVRRRWDRQREADERNRQARLEDLRQAWAALAPLVARPRGFDEDDLAQPFAAAIRQLQLSGSEPVLVELENVTSTLLRQGTDGARMAVDLGPLTEAVRNEYRRLHDLKPTTRQFVPFAIVSREVADRWRREPVESRAEAPES